MLNVISYSIFDNINIIESFGNINTYIFRFDPDSIEWKINNLHIIRNENVYEILSIGRYNHIELDSFIRQISDKVFIKESNIPVGVRLKKFKIDYPKIEIFK